MLSLTTTKILTMLLTGLVPVFLGLIPMKAGRYINSDNKRHQSIVSCLLCFGAGILLATSMIHMLPEVRENLELGLSGSSFSSDGLAETLLCAGFFVIYFVEELVHFACDRDLQHDHCEEFDHTQSINIHRTFSIRPGQCDAGRNCGPNCGCVCVDAATATPSDGESPSAAAATASHHDADHHHHQVVHSDHQQTRSSRHMHHQSLRRSGHRHGSTSSTRSTISESLAQDSNYNTFSNSQQQLHRQSQQQHGTHRNSLTATQGHHTSTVRDFLTVLALSFHAVFEGLAVGLEDKVSNVWTLYIAVSLHKYVISFCVGLELFTKNQNPLLVNLSYILVYAVMSPIGIGIGIAVTSLVTPDNAAYFLAVGALQAIAGGTILYVVVFEVLQREKSKQKVPGLMQFLCVTLGFTTMFLVERFGPSD